MSGMPAVAITVPLCCSVDEGGAGARIPLFLSATTSVAVSKPATSSKQIGKSLWPCCFSVLLCSHA